MGGPEEETGLFETTETTDCHGRVATSLLCLQEYLFPRVVTTRDVQKESHGCGIIQQIDMLEPLNNLLPVMHALVGNCLRELRLRSDFTRNSLPLHAQAARLRRRTFFHPSIHWLCNLAKCVLGVACHSLQWRSSALWDC
jgi:hypothetical protein